MNIHSQTIFLSWLSTKTTISIKKCRAIIEVYPDLTEAYKDQFQRVSKKYRRSLQNVHFDKEHPQKIEEFCKDLEQTGIKIVSFLDTNYPKQLLEHEFFPAVLFYQGDIALLNQTYLTIVGSRSVHEYGSRLIQTILRPVCRSGINVVSGMAIGIDTLAHQTALESHAKTIAVLGSGLGTDSIYPRQNLGLMKTIIENGGLVLSQYGIHNMPEKHTFLERNRIMAALSPVTWIVQAGTKSGSLTTAYFAQELGKTVATSPADVLEVSFAGNIQLLKNGSSLICSSEDIIELLQLTTHSLTPSPSRDCAYEFNSILAEQIYNHLQYHPINVEEIAERLATTTQLINLEFSLLELDGKIKHVGENNWIRLS